MKTANSSLLAILAGNVFQFCDLYTIALKNGTTLYYTDADKNVVTGGITYICNDTLITDGSYKMQKGTEVDEMQITLYPPATETVNGIPYLDAVVRGLFDRAGVTRCRQFFTPTEAAAYVRKIVPSANAPIIFYGEIVNADVTQNQVVFKVDSLLYLLDVNMPRRQYQPQCSFVFGDARCGFNRTTIAENSNVGAGSMAWVINCGLADADGYYNNGTVKFTSGSNTGVSRSVLSWKTGQITLFAPFPNPIVTGDAFTITPGCTKNLTGQINSYNCDALIGCTSGQINTGLNFAAGTFVGGTIQATSGVNMGQERTINASGSDGVIIPNAPFPVAPNIGDGFTITTTGSNSASSCTAHFSTNAPLHFGGTPFVPTPETAY
jgi:uncharacterized phage protein (TIGR02218 family)